MKHKPINNEKYNPDGEIIMTFDFEHDLSIDVVSIDKCVFPDSNSNERGYEGRIYRRDGSGDYSPIDLHWKELPTEKELIEFDFSDWINEEIDKNK